MHGVETLFRERNWEAPLLAQFQGRITKSLEKSGVEGAELSVDDLIDETLGALPRLGKPRATFAAAGSVKVEVPFEGMSAWFRRAGSTSTSLPPKAQVAESHLAFYVDGVHDSTVLDGRVEAFVANVEQYVAFLGADRQRLVTTLRQVAGTVIERARGELAVASATRAAIQGSKYSQ